MGWIKPKTDWAVSYDELGNYTGDRFNARDFNRIKNNIAYLRDTVEKRYGSNISAFVELNEKSTYDYFFASEINAMWSNLNAVSVALDQTRITPVRVYEAGGTTMTASELNELESATLALYNRINGALRMFTWNFGIKEVF